MSSPTAAVWPERQPQYLPDTVWQFALEWREKGFFQNPPLQEAALMALMAPGMKTTWESLTQRINHYDVQSWRLLLDLFVTSTPGLGFCPELRDGLKETQVLVTGIAKHVSVLAEMLERLTELRNKYNLPMPSEVSSALALLEKAGYCPPILMKPWNVEEFEQALVDIPVSGLLYALADSIDDLIADDGKPNIQPAYPHEAHATTSKGGLVTEWVRAIDSRLRNYYADHIWPRGFTLSHGELVTIGSAVLGFDVQRKTVEQARKRAPADLW